MILRLTLIFLMGSVASSTPAFAFVEMIRHGYMNCTSCHVSPSGGGVLTSYGRETSEQLLAMFSKEGEASWIRNVAHAPDWLNATARVAALQMRRSTPQVTADRFFLMQIEAEVAATMGAWTADVSGGTYNGTDPASRSHYFNYRPSDSLSFRAGKFTRAFGLMTPNHVSAITRGLGFDEGMQTYNLEAAYLGDSWNTYLTGNFGNFEAGSRQAEKGATIRSAYSLGDRSQLGVSYHYGQLKSLGRQVFGPFVVVGFTPRLFLLSEFDYQFRNGQRGFATWHRFDHEPIQGLHFYLVAQAARAFHGYGLGSQFFPRPRFQFDLMWERQKLPQFAKLTDEITLLMRLYL